MFTESSLREHPAVIKAFTGLPAEAFWDLIEKIKEHLPAYEAQRLGRADRQRAHLRSTTGDPSGLGLDLSAPAYPARGSGATLRGHAGGCVARVAPLAARAPASAALPSRLGADRRGSRSPPRAVPRPGAVERWAGAD